MHGANNFFSPYLSGCRRFLPLLGRLWNILCPPVGWYLSGSRSTSCCSQLCGEEDAQKVRGRQGRYKQSMYLFVLYFVHFLFPNLFSDINTWLINKENKFLSGVSAGRIVFKGFLDVNSINIILWNLHVELFNGCILHQRRWPLSHLPGSIGKP